MIYTVRMGRCLSVISMIFLIGCSSSFNPIPVSEVGTVRAVTITNTEATLHLRLRTWDEWTMEVEGEAVTLTPGEIYAFQQGLELNLRIDIEEIVYGDYLIFNGTWISPSDRQNLQAWYESKWDSWLTIEL